TSPEGGVGVRGVWRGGRGPARGMAAGRPVITMSGPTAVEAEQAGARGLPGAEAVASRPRAGGTRRINWGEARLAYLLLAPSAALLATFGLFPLGYAFLLSLRERGSMPGSFVGFANYVAVLGRDAEFWRSLSVTLFYV